jgi:peroxiredoxin
MDLQTRKYNKIPSHILPLVLIGFGLIVLGLVAAKVITSGNPSSDYTVVPRAVNFPAPELTLNNLAGEKVSIADYKQQIVLINNWATWCPPCKSEMPTLSKYYEEHRDHGFILFGIEAGEPKEEVESFVEEYGLSFPILLDPNSKSLIAFHNDNLPSSYVIDHEGNVILAWTGPINKAMLEKYVTPLLEQ